MAIKMTEPRLLIYKDLGTTCAGDCCKSILFPLGGLDYLVKEPPHERPRQVQPFAPVVVPVVLRPPAQRTHQQTVDDVTQEVRLPGRARLGVISAHVRQKVRLQELGRVDARGDFSADVFECGLWNETRKSEERLSNKKAICGTAGNGFGRRRNRALVVEAGTESSCKHSF